MEKINIYHVDRIGENLLGPGQRIGIWLQGCEHGCPGCIVPESWDTLKQRTLYTPQELYSFIQKLLNDDNTFINGLTISGGEPFLQSLPLADFLQICRLAQPNWDVLCFSGFLYEDLQKIAEYQSLLNYVDILIDGPYIQELNENQMWRGSENQRIILLNSRYNAQTFAKITKHKFRKMEIAFNNFSYTLIGIPPKTPNTTPSKGTNFESLLGLQQLEQYRL